MSSIIKVLVVDDSAFMRKIITDIINNDSRLEVIAKARNGHDALDKLDKYKPDVVTLDLELPDMSGLEVLDKIMQNSPTPTIILSTLSTKGAKVTMDAIKLGAVDFITKPSGAISLDLDKIDTDIVEKIISASSAKIQQKATKKERKMGVNRELIDYGINVKISTNTNIISIGSSTGGPKALQEILPVFPKNIQAPILIVQHMPPHFTASLAERLNNLSEVTVKEAKDGDVLHNGTAYVAPGGYQMKVMKQNQSLTIKTIPSHVVNGHCPSVDVLFSSLSQLKDVNIISAILTGMGSDGSLGLVDMKKNSNTYAIAESEETATIFGMPKSAIRTGLIDDIVPIHQMAQTIINKL